MPPSPEKAVALARVRSAEEKMRKRAQKKIDETPGTMPSFVTFPEFAVIFVILLITDVLDILLVLGTIGVGKAATIIIDIALVAIVFTWSYFRLHELPPERLSRIATRGKWKGKLLATFFGEFIPLLGLVPWWTFWIIIVYLGQRKLKREIEEAQYTYA